MERIGLIRLRIGTNGGTLVMLANFLSSCTIGNCIPPFFTYFESFICLVFFSFVVSSSAFPVFPHVL
jgi:hypothetical protein